jgi:hypothetical protein
VTKDSDWDSMWFTVEAHGLAHDLTGRTEAAHEAFLAAKDAGWRVMKIGDVIAEWPIVKVELKVDPAVVPAGVAS